MPGREAGGCCFWLRGREPGAGSELAGGSSGWPASAGHTPEKRSWQASQGGRQEQVRISVLALSHDLTLHSLTSLPRGPSAGLVVSKEEASIRLSTDTMSNPPGQTGRTVPSPSLLLNLRAGGTDRQCGPGRGREEGEAQKPPGATSWFPTGPAF